MKARRQLRRARRDDELTGELDMLGKEIFNLRFQRASGQLENTARVRQVRRDIARIKTILGERRRARAAREEGNVRNASCRVSSSATPATRR